MEKAEVRETSPLPPLIMLTIKLSRYEVSCIKDYAAVDRRTGTVTGSCTAVEVIELIKSTQL